MLASELPRQFAPQRTHHRTIGFLHRVAGRDFVADEHHAFGGWQGCGPGVVQDAVDAQQLVRGRPGAQVVERQHRVCLAAPERPILFSERGGGLSPATVRLWFHRMYTLLKMDGCSSHSGRRTFITRAARRVSQVGGSLRDVQELAGHTSLAMTQRYIEGDTDAKRKLIALL